MASAKDYIIFGAKDCEFCDDAKILLETLGFDYTFVLLSDDYKQEVKRFYDWSTVPIVLSRELETGLVKFIGGFSDLEAFLSEQN